jgi:hypothetical protein
VTQCPRCGHDVAAGQEYCLSCGLRLPGVSRLGPLPTNTRTLVVPLLLAGVVAAAGASTAIALTRETATATPIVTATGGSDVVSTPASTTNRLTEWPAKKSAWTNIVVSIPKVQGRDAALARAEQARRRGLRQIGVLDSSRFSSLHPGYWVVFAGVYPSQPEATSRLREAKGVQRGAHTARISR